MPTSRHKWNDSVQVHTCDQQAALEPHLRQYAPVQVISKPHLIIGPTEDHPMMEFVGDESENGFPINFCPFCGVDLRVEFAPSGEPSNHILKKED